MYGNGRMSHVLSENRIDIYGHDLCKTLSEHTVFTVERVYNEAVKKCYCNYSECLTCLFAERVGSLFTILHILAVVWRVRAAVTVCRIYNHQLHRI